MTEEKEVEKVCGTCSEMMRTLGQCGHPMVYLNHTTNIYLVKETTPACGFYSKETGHLPLDTEPNTTVVQHHD